MPLENEGDVGQGITIEAKLTPKGIILTGASLSSFGTHHDLLGGRESEKPLPPGSVLRVSGDEKPVEIAIDCIRLQISGTVIRVLGASNQKKHVTLPEQRTEKPAEESTAPLSDKRELSLAEPATFRLSSHGILELDEDMKTTLQTGGIMKALLSREPVHVSLPAGSILRGGSQVRKLTHCTLQLIGTGITVLSASDGEKSVFRNTVAAAISTAAASAEPVAAGEAAKKDKDVALIPLLQTKAGIEREMRMLLEKLAERIEQVWKQKQQESGASPEMMRKTVPPIPWPRPLLQAIDRMAVEFAKLRERATAPLPAPAIASTAGTGLRGMWRRTLGHEIVEPEINPRQPTFVSSAIVEILQSGTVCGEQIPVRVRDLIRSFVQALRAGDSIGEGVYAVEPSKQAVRFGAFAENQYEFKGVKGDEEDIGFTDRRKPWTQLQALLANGGAKRAVQEVAFRQVAERMTAESANAHAPETDADQKVRVAYDETLLSAMQLARNSSFYDGLSGTEKAAFDARCAQATGNIQKRNLIQKMDANWYRTQAAKNAKGGKSVRSNNV